MYTFKSVINIININEMEKSAITGIFVFKCTINTNKI